jgi:adenosylcobinamide amidohydrolase
MQVSKIQLTEHIVAAHGPDHLYFALDIPHQVISSAVLNGGECFADHVVNMRVPEIECDDMTELPATTIDNYCLANGWHGASVGMMTTASMKTFRMAENTTEGVKTAVLLTADLGNARRAGDMAEHRHIASTIEKTGTINIIIVTTAKLSASALIECVQIITEAKAATLEELNIKSPVSGLTATGTGTDSVAIINGQGPKMIEYCGKHMLFGEILAKLVMQALKQSLQSSG